MQVVYWPGTVANVLFCFFMWPVLWQSCFGDRCDFLKLFVLHIVPYHRCWSCRQFLHRPVQKISKDDNIAEIMNAESNTFWKYKIEIKRLQCTSRFRFRVDRKRWRNSWQLPQGLGKLVPNPKDLRATPTVFVYESWMYIRIPVWQYA